jgi:hypothetical protein
LIPSIARIRSLTAAALKRFSQSAYRGSSGMVPLRKAMPLAPEARIPEHAGELLRQCGPQPERPSSYGDDGHASSSLK